MFGLGTFEIVLIVLVILVLFGGSRIPALGKGLGEGLRNFRDAFKGPSSADPRAATSIEKKNSDPTDTQPKA